MQTQEMVAGREMDALVAEKVMKLMRGTNQCGAEGWALSRGDYELRYVRQDEAWDGVYIMPSAPPYSTDIGAAFQVVDHLRPRGRVVVTVYEDGSARAEVYLTRLPFEPPNGTAYGDTAPEAICRAALAAIAA